MLSVFERELDKRFYGVEFNENSTVELSTCDYLQCREPLPLTEYRLLIMEGSGDAVNGLPSKLITRLKNKLHRSVYIELEHYRDGQGVVRQCCYYDRKYIRQNITITPPSLVSVFFPYTRDGILDLVNREICCNFTHIITIDGSEGIDLVSDAAPICGSIKEAEHG